jgi:hypothetical protein
MESFSNLETQNLLTSKKQIIFLLYLGIISVISHYVFPSEPIIVEVRHPKPVNLHDSLRTPNYMVQGDNLITDDEITTDTDTKKSFILILALAASLIMSSKHGIERGALKNSVNSFRYDSSFGYSPLRSPPTITYC